MVSQYIRNENVNQIAHEQARVCSTRKWAKLEHKSCLVMSSNLGFIWKKKKKKSKWTNLNF